MYIYENSRIPQWNIIILTHKQTYDRKFSNKEVNLILESSVFVEIKYFILNDV